MRQLYIVAAVVCFALSGAIAPAALGQSPGDTVGALSDLVGAKPGQAEAEVKSKGYTWVKTEQGKESSFSYWTEKGSDNCVSIRTADGLYQAIVYAPKTDCEGETEKEPGRTTKTQSQCKLYDEKSDSYKYEGDCEMIHIRSGNVYDVTLGNGNTYHFLGHGTKYRLTTPKGESDNKVAKLEKDGSTVFEWKSLKLTVSEK